MAKHEQVWSYSTEDGFDAVVWLDDDARNGGEVYTLFVDGDFEELLPATPENLEKLKTKGKSCADQLQVNLEGLREIQADEDEEVAQGIADEENALGADE